MGSRWGEASPAARACWCLAAALMLVVGFFYLTSGLVVPAPWLFGLWALWAALGWWLLSLRYRAVALAVPALAAVLWLLVLSAGGAWLGWAA